MAARPKGTQLKVPEGFQIEEYRPGFTTPRFMLSGPAGEILISDATDAASRSASNVDTAEDPMRAADAKTNPKPPLKEFSHKKHLALGNVAPVTA